MKTAQQMLIDNDCLQESVSGLPERIISTDKDRFIKVIKEYAKEAIEQCVLMIENESWICENEYNELGIGQLLSGLADKIEQLKEELK